MGCNASRLDGLPAVTLCRDRCNLLDEALRQSYAVADAHVAHLESLKTLGPALHSFFHHLETAYSSSHDAAAPAQLKSPLSHSSDSDSDSSNSSKNNVVHSESEAEDEDSDKELSRFFNQTRYDSSPPPPSSVNYSQPPLYTAPSPPPPLASSAWDFLNFFETFDKYQVPYSPNRGTEVLKEEKEEEQEIKNKKKEKISSTRGHKGDNRKVKSENKNKKKEEDAPQPLETKSSAATKGKGMSETMKEIQILFERASDSGKPILEMLDVGKLRYHRNIAVNPVPCKLMHVFTSSPHSKPLSNVRMHNKARLSYGSNLSSTLNKLCMWEKKLYDEVKAVEKLRMLHENKCRQLRRMNKKGADAHKVDSIETIIGVLSTKMKISFQVVDKISNTISDLREHELWPHINTFIFRFFRMWKDMLECYRCQHKEIAEAKSLDASRFNRKLSNSHIDAAIKLKSEIQNWNLSFSDWIFAQKSHVKALNGWLVRCLMHDPEEVAHDDSTAFSPARIGAPPVFVICTKWSRAMDNLSEKEVIESVNAFIRKVNELLENHISELKQKLTLDKELERQVKVLEKQEQKMHKVVQARQRKMVSNAGEDTTNAVHHGDVTGTVGLQSSVQNIFEAVENFTASMVSTYEELSQQIEQENHVPGEVNSIH